MSESSVKDPPGSSQNGRANGKHPGHPTIEDVDDARVRGHRLGFSTMVPTEDGVKRPDAPEWTGLQTARVNEGQLERWRDVGRTGNGVIAGRVSGGGPDLSLNWLDFDDSAMWDRFLELAETVGFRPLVEKLAAGYLEDTPKGGKHLPAYVQSPDGKTWPCEKLAERPDPTKKNGRITLIETKCEGGFIILAPSFGRVHPSGKPYLVAHGRLETIATISGEEWQALCDIASTLDEMPPSADPKEEKAREKQDRKRPDGKVVSVIDDYNARTSWDDHLPDWADAYTKGETRGVIRPGKHKGIGATINHGGTDKLYIFTTTTDLPVRKFLSKFAVYAHREHAGDYDAAVKALSRAGYGQTAVWVWKDGRWTPQVLDNPCSLGRMVRLREPGKGAPPPPKGESKAQAEGGAGKGGGNRAGQGEQDGDREPFDFTALSDEDMGISPLRLVKERPIRPLWKHRLERGSLALMAGDAGIGKSQVLLHTAATVSKGGPWADGSGNAPLGNVVIVSAEDRADQTIKPRLLAMGADIDRITIVKAKYIVKRAGKLPEVNFTSFQDRPYWLDVFRRLPDVVLFVVDPLPSYLGRGVNDSKNTEIRQVLEPLLSEVIEPLDICMWGNTHLNKTVDNKTPLHRITGSIAYGALPRNVHFVVRDPENRQRRFFKQAKCNNAPDDLPAIAFTVEQREVTSDDGEVIETAIPVFETELVNLDLAVTVNGAQGAKRGPGSEKTMKVSEWLFDRLASSPSPSLLAALFDEAGAAGLIGTKRAVDNKWTGSSILYEAAKRIETLPSPRDGKRVESLHMPVKERGRACVHWYLISAEAAF